MKQLIISAMIFIQLIFVFSCATTPELVKAVEEGNSAKVQALLKDGVDVNEISTALNKACRNGDYDIAKLLLQNGADPNLNDPLFTTAYNRHWDIANLLIEYGADGKNLTHITGGSTLSKAIQDGQKDIAKIIIENNPNVDFRFRTDEGIRTFIYATIKTYVDLVGLMVDKGADVNMQDNAICSRGTTTFYHCDKGYSALMFAITNNDLEMVKLLLHYGADPNLNIVIEGARPESMNSELFKVLMDENSSFTITGLDTYIKEKTTTPLEYAKKNGLTEIVNLIESKKIQ